MCVKNFTNQTHTSGQSFTKNPFLKAPKLSTPAKCVDTGFQRFGESQSPLHAILPSKSAPGASWCLLSSLPSHLGSDNARILCELRLLVSVDTFQVELHSSRMARIPARWLESWMENKRAAKVSFAEPSQVKELKQSYRFSRPVIVYNKVLNVLMLTNNFFLS